jgi:hypothetical protein
MSKKYKEKAKPLLNYLKKNDGLHEFESFGFENSAIELFDIEYGDTLTNKLKEYFETKSKRFYKPVSHDEVEEDFGELIKAIKEEIFRDFNCLWNKLGNSNIHADALKKWQRFLILKIKRNLDDAFKEMWKDLSDAHWVYSTEYFAKDTDAEDLTTDLNSLGVGSPDRE